MPSYLLRLFTLMKRSVLSIIALHVTIVGQQVCVQAFHFAGHVLGHVLPMVSGHHWSHLGITRLYNSIKVSFRL